MRVLHLPTQVGGNAWNLSRAEREIGLQSDVLYWNQDPYFGHLSDLHPEFVNQKRAKRYINIARFYDEVMDQYDVFHFNFGSSLCMFRSSLCFMDCIDLPFLRKHNKVIAVTYQGSDARQADYCIQHYPINYFSHYSKEKLDWWLRFSKIQRMRISRFDRYADLIYATNPDLVNMLPHRTKFRPYTKLDIRDYDTVYNDYSLPTLTVVHAPTNREIKGTQYVLDAVQKLQSEGYPVELKLVENMSNQDALKLYHIADVIVDQLLAGWYGGFAVECMAMGKPVIAYIRESDLCNIPAGMKQNLPLINAEPDTLYDVLKRISENKASLAETARQSRAYVEKWHNRSAIARDIAHDYQNALDKRYL